MTDGPWEDFQAQPEAGPWQDFQPPADDSKPPWEDFAAKPPTVDKETDPVEGFLRRHLGDTAVDIMGAPVRGAGKMLGEGITGISDLAKAGIRELGMTPSEDETLANIGRNITQRYETSVGHKGAEPPGTLENIEEAAGAGLPMIAAGPAGLGVGAALMGGQGAEQQMQAAKQSGADQATQDKVALEGFLPNAALALIPGHQLARFMQLPAAARSGVIAVAKRYGESALEGGSVMAAAQAVNNAIAQNYDPNRSIGEGLGEAAGTGAALGVVLHTPMERARAQAGLPVRELTPEETAQRQEQQAQVQKLRDQLTQAQSDGDTDRVSRLVSDLRRVANGDRTPIANPETNEQGITYPTAVHDGLNEDDLSHIKSLAGEDWMTQPKLDLAIDMMKASRSIVPEDTKVRFSQKLFQGDQEVNGLYNPGVINIALDAAEHQKGLPLLDTTAHESTHAVQDYLGRYFPELHDDVLGRFENGLPPDVERSLASMPSEVEGMSALDVYRQQEERGVFDKYSPKDRASERMAFAYALYHNARVMGDTMRLQAQTRSFFQKTYDWFRNLGQRLAGRGQTLNDLQRTGVFEDIYTGRTKGQIEEAAARTGEPQEELEAASRTQAPEEAQPSLREFLGNEEERLKPPQEITNPVSGTPGQKVRGLRQLTAQNRPLVQDIAKQIEDATGQPTTDNLKQVDRILEKARRPTVIQEKPWHDVEHIRDSYRFKTPMNTFGDFAKALGVFARNGVNLVKLDAAKMFNPKGWGFRFAAADLRLPNGQITEYYMPLKEVEAVKAQGHKIFEKWRNQTPDYVSKHLDAYRQDMLASQDLYGGAFQKALQRMGYSSLEDARADWSNSLNLLGSSTNENFSNVSRGGMNPSRQLPLLSRTRESPGAMTNARPSSEMPATGLSSRRKAVELPVDYVSHNPKAGLRAETKDLVRAAKDFSSWRDWYDRHKPIVKELFGKDAHLFEKLLAATSQHAAVNSNVTLALKAYKQLRSGEPFTGYLPAVIKNLERVKSGEAAAGPKIGAFEGATAHDLADKVVTDIHISRLLFGVDKPNRQQHEIARNAVTEVAKRLKWTPREAQAALWAYSITRQGRNFNELNTYATLLEQRADQIRGLRASLDEPGGAGEGVPGRGGAGEGPGEGLASRAEYLKTPGEKGSLKWGDLRVGGVKYQARLERGYDKGGQGYGLVHAARHAKELAQALGIGGSPAQVIAKAYQMGLTAKPDQFKDRIEGQKIIRTVSLPGKQPYEIVMGRRPLESGQDGLTLITAYPPRQGYANEQALAARQQYRQDQGLASIRTNVEGAVKTMREKVPDEWRRGLALAISPMTRGTVETRYFAKNFANGLVKADYHYNQLDNYLLKTFSKDRRAVMGQALDEESVAAQTGTPVAPGKGFQRLSQPERDALTLLDRFGQELWQRAIDVGVLHPNAARLPHYMPRMLVNINAGVASHVGGSPTGGGPNTNDAYGRVGANLTTTPFKGRKHMTPEETLKAAQDRFGSNVELVRDIRALPLALKRLERATAGRDLVNAIEAYMPGATSTSSAATTSTGKAYVTIPHPAFQVYRPRFEIDHQTGKVDVVKDENGDPVFDRVPLHVHPDFEGPLKAVLSRDSNVIHRGYMGLKGRAMQLIMYSPLIHLSVEFGRAFPAAPGKVISLRAFREGKAFRLHDTVGMEEAIDGGFRPQSIYNPSGGDAPGIVNENLTRPGRSWTAKGLGLLGRPFGAEDAIRSAVDKAGHFWHQTLLWDKIADLQAGLYKHFRDHLIKQGYDRQAAVVMAAHEANRFAGSLPKESLGHHANAVAHWLLFSRSFTLGNLGVYKDAVNGLPLDAQALVQVRAGEQELQKAMAGVRRKAAGAIIADFAITYIGYSVAQDMIKELGKGTPFGDAAYKALYANWAERWQDESKLVQEDPWLLLHPLDRLSDLTAMRANEDRYKFRAKIGHDEKGTALYLRNPFGKIGEELTGWASAPLDMMKRKLSTVARPLWEVVSNDKGFGQKVYDPNDSAPLAMGKALMRFANANLPIDAVMGAIHYITANSGNKEKNMEAIKFLGPFTGFTLSHGAPGGEVMGAIYAQKDRMQNERKEAMPDINRKIDNGDIGGAVQDMAKLGMSAKAIREHIKSYMVPGHRVTPSALKSFQKQGTPREKATLKWMMDERER